MPVFSDTFTAAVDVELSLHLPDTGTSWTLLWQSAIGTQAGINSTSDNLGQSGAANGGAIYTADATYPSADYSVQATRVSFSGAASQSWGLQLRTTDQENFYLFNMRGVAGAASGAEIQKKVAGAYTVLGAAFANPTAGQVVKFQAIGSGLKVFYDGVEKASRTDTAITATGKAGIAMAGGAERPDAGDDPGGGQIDDFEVTDLGGAPPAAVPTRTLMGVGT